MEKSGAAIGLSSGKLTPQVDPFLLAARVILHEVIKDILLEFHMLFVNSAKCFSQVSLKYKRIDYRKQLAYIITNIVVFKQTRLVQNLKETLCISSIPNELLPMRNSMLCSIRPAVSMKPQKGGNRK